MPEPTCPIPDPADSRTWAHSAWGFVGEPLPVLLWAGIDPPAWPEVAGEPVLHWVILESDPSRALARHAEQLDRAIATGKAPPWPMIPILLEGCDYLLHYRRENIADLVNDAGRLGFPAGTVALDPEGPEVRDAGGGAYEVTWPMSVNYKTDLPPFESVSEMLASFTAEEVDRIQREAMDNVTRDMNRRVWELAGGIPYRVNPTRYSSEFPYRMPWDAPSWARVMPSESGPPSPSEPQGSAPPYHRADVGARKARRMRKRGY